MFSQVTGGYASATVDGGVEHENGSSVAEWALTSPGNVDYNALQDFAFNGLIDGALKALSRLSTTLPLRIRTGMAALKAVDRVIFSHKDFQTFLMESQQPRPPSIGVHSSLPERTLIKCSTNSTRLVFRTPASLKLLRKLL